MQRILPVMRRTDLVSAAVSAKIDIDLFSIPRIAGVLLPIWIDAREFMISLNPDFIIQTDRGEKAVPLSELTHHGVDHTALRDLHLRMSSGNALYDELKMIIKSLPISDVRSEATLLILPNSQIVVRDDASSFIKNARPLFQEKVQEESTRAPCCTMLLPPRQTAHEAIDEYMRVAHDLYIFRQIKSELISTLQDYHGIYLENPTPNELLQVKPL